jgi:hypothetical protein
MDAAGTGVEGGQDGVGVDATNDSQRGGGGPDSGDGGGGSGMTVDSGDAHACSFASSYVDGCSGAPLGTPKNPSLLSGYSMRPPWAVASVDYHVGVPSGTALKDPTTAALPTGCSFSGSSVTCSGNAPIVLDGYDFSLHNGTTLSIEAANITVQNSLFVVGSNQGNLGRIIDVTGSAGEVTFLNNEVDGNHTPVAVQQGQTINVENVGTATFEYNYFHDSGGDMIDFGGGPAVDVFRYNLMEDIGYLVAHSDTLQWYDSQVISADISFNVVDQTAAGLSGNGLLVPCSEGSAGTISNLIEHNNTLISKVQDNFGVGFYANLGGVADHMAMFDNYIDPTGIDGYTGSPWMATESSDLAHPMAMYGLTDMVTGSSIPIPTASNPTSQGYYVYPDGSGYSPSLSDVYTITASPKSGTLTKGGTVTFTLTMDEPWTVTGTPTLGLNDGGTAAYVSGSGTAVLTFTHTVGSSNTAVSSLAVTGVNVANGSALRDGVGNVAHLTTVTATFSGLQVSP